MKKKWYEEWFETKYYDILYNKRNNKEAELFLNNLFKYIKPNKKSNFIDIACGSGRHTNYIGKLGYKITGFDLSINKIKKAKKQKNNNSSFYVHDMKKVYKENHFDYVLNLFTSFGYFETKNENQKVINNFHKTLNKKGKLIFDYINFNKILNNFNKKETKEIDNIKFKIEKKIEQNKLIKKIEVTDSKKHKYEEILMILKYNEIIKMIENEKFKISKIFGDYKLQDFKINQSPRLIIIADKI